MAFESSWQQVRTTVAPRTISTVSSGLKAACSHEHGDPKVLPLGEIWVAHALLEGGNVFEKLVLDPKCPLHTDVLES
jgi:hypothetical protein